MLPRVARRRGRALGGEGLVVDGYRSDGLTEGDRGDTVAAVRGSGTRETGMSVSVVDERCQVWSLFHRCVSAIVDTFLALRIVGIGCCFGFALSEDSTRTN